MNPGIVALPVLLFRLIATAPFERFEWFLVLAFLLAEFALYAAGYSIARFGFGRSRTESLLLGMSAGGERKAPAKRESGRGLSFLNSNLAVQSAPNHRTNYQVSGLG